MEIAEALKRLSNYIDTKQLITSGDKLILGCSGGADSTALLFMFSRLRRNFNISLLAVHINHQLRGEESNADEQVVKELCLSLNVPLIIRRVSLPKSGNLENHARKARFEAFDQVIKNYAYDKIVLAHHRDDQAETVLLNLLRGSGVSGMAGIKPLAGMVVHPLLCFNRMELEALLDKNQIKWRTDSSNMDNSFSRNRIRNDLLPKLSSEYNPAIKSHLAAVADVFLEAEGILLSRSKQQYKRLTIDSTNVRVILDLPALIKLSKIERYYVLRTAFRHLSGKDTDFMSAHYNAIEEVLSVGGSKKISLPHDVEVKKTYEELVLYTAEEPKNIEVDHLEIDADRTRAVFGDYRFTFKYLRILPKETMHDMDSLSIFIDADKISYPFKIRFRKPGDRFIPFGMQHFKRLKEFFIDEKVPKYDRDSLPVFDDGEKLFWIVGYRIDNRVRRDETSIRYLHIVAEPTTSKPRRAAKKMKNTRGNNESDEL